VVCVNRGPNRIVDKFNAHDYAIPGFAMFEVEYQAAVHLQRRAIVPGTKNPDPSDPTMPQYVSWLSILGIDTPEACEVFTDEQLARFGESVEGLNRSAFATAEQRNVAYMSTATLRAALPGTGVAASESAMLSSYGGVSYPNQSVDGSPDAVAAALAPVTDSDARVEQEHAQGSGWIPPAAEELKGEASAPPPAAPPIGRRKPR